MRLVSSLAALVFSISSLQAGVILTIGNNTLPAGGSGTVDVTAYGNDGGFLDLFGLELRITRISGTGSLEFLSPQLFSELGSPNYVFNGDSLNQLFGGFAVITTFGTTNDTYIGGDGTISGSGIFLPGSGSPILLATLDLNALGAAPGDVYQISVVGSGNTLFQDPGFNPIGYSSTSGTVTITETSSVPEPASIVTLGLGIAGLLGYRWHRKPTDKPTAATIAEN